MNQEYINCIQRMYFLSIDTTNETTTETTKTTMEPSKLSLTNMNKNVFFMFIYYFKIIYQSCNK